MNVKLKNAILNIDEGHNIPDVCAESYTKKIEIKDIEEVVKILTKFKNNFIKNKYSIEQSSVFDSKSNKNEKIIY